MAKRICGKRLPTGGICTRPAGCSIIHGAAPVAAIRVSDQATSIMEADALLAKVTNAGASELMLMAGDQKADLRTLVTLARKPRKEEVLSRLLVRADLPGVVISTMWDESRSMMSRSLELRLLRHRSCPVEVLDSALDSRSPHLRGAALANPNCDASIIRKAFDKWSAYEIRLGLAQNPKCPEDILGSLASEGGACLQNVLQNENCPLDVLERFAARGDLLQIGYAMSNPRSTVEMVETVLARGNEEAVLVVKSRACPTELVSRIADSRPDDQFRPARLGALMHPNLPIEKLRRIAEHPQTTSDGGALARNPECPADVLRDLFVRWRSLHNGVSERTFAKMIVKHPNTDVDTLRMVCRRSSAGEDAIFSAAAELTRRGAAAS